MKQELNVSNVPAAGLAESLTLVERWAEDEDAKVGPGTVLRRHKALMALARRLGDRTLAEATVGDIEAWLATVGSRTRETYATAVRSFYTWAVVQQEVSPAADPSRVVRCRVVGVFEPSAELMNGWRASMKHRGLAPGTIDKRGKELRLLQTWIGPDRSPLEVTADEIEKWLDTRLLSSNSRRDAISGVHSLFVWAVRMRMIDHDPTVLIDRPKAVVGMPRPISDQDLALALDRAPAKIRCWLLLAAYAGLRCQEIAGLERADVMEHETPALLLVRHGKGRKQRVVPLHPEIIEALNRAGLPRTGPLFVAGSPVRPRQVSPTTVSLVGNRFLHDEGIEATMHQLRHWFGTHTYRASLDLRMTQELLGHSSPNTTTIYAAWSPGAAVPIVQGLSAGGAR